MEIQGYTQREGKHRGTETEVTPIGTKQCQGLLATARREEQGIDQIHLKDLQKEATLLILRLWTSSLQNCERTDFC